jgi:tetratricopeptide (TPR) repeat protein
VRPGHSLALLAACALAACASKQRPGTTPDTEPTLKTLAGRSVVVAPDSGVEGDLDKTIAAYKSFLEAAPKSAQRPEAMRRLGDLEMDNADMRAASGESTTGVPDYKVAVARYQDYLKAYPNDPAIDRVLYQLARAQEQAGELEVSLKTLDRLVAEHPKTIYRDEAEFRRGELLFTLRDYPKAEKAYATVLSGDSGNPYRDRALYMQGWSQFKQARLDDAVRSFFGVLDLKLADRSDETELEALPGLTRGDRELLEDTFRVTSISLANLQGAESIPAYIDSEMRQGYEFRVYQQLGELYLKQDRVKDAADTLSAFARRQPLHAQAPQLQARVIEIYQANGFAMLAIDAKKDYVSRYGIDSAFRRANPEGWEKAQPLIKTHLTELARYHHAVAQKSKTTADYQEAVRWYRVYLTSFPDDPQAAQNNFLLAELLREDNRLPEAAVEYEKTAYGYVPHEKSADAGYSALLSYAGQERRAAPSELPALQGTAVESALRFAKAFPSDSRSGAVLTNAAEKLYALRDGERASAVAQQVLALDPPASGAQRRVAHTVIANTAFERGSFDAAERSYGEVLALMGERDAGRAEMVERQAASIYKQGEQARAAGQARDAVGHFTRVATVAPQSAVRANAQYDAAAALIGLKDWEGAARTLEDFRQRFPNHPLQADVGSKLAVAYLEQGRWSQAAGELERVAGTAKDPTIARNSLWQAAELHEKAADKPPTRAVATKAYERYLKQHPEPFEFAVEARYRMARLAKADGNAARELALQREVQLADLRGGAARTARTRTLGGLASLALAAPAVDAYRKVPLVEPLARQLKLKKAKMEDVLKVYAQASEYGVAEVTTAATFETAALYNDFGKAMLNSQRPRGLKKIELEQYNVLLEEQAFPFEEKAIELHETNTKRAAEGIYDEWVKKSFKALAELRPVRYGKNERSEVAFDAIR